MPIAVGKRSRQNLSSTFYGTHDFGRMDVVYCNSDIVPGDDINLKVDGFLRGAPMPAPTFGDVDIDIRVFFVPHRLSTSRPNNVASGGFSWEDFISGVSTNAHPYATFSYLSQALIGSNTDLSAAEKIDAKRLLSELGFPSTLVNVLGESIVSSKFGGNKYNLWSLLAYQRIWWDYYRDSSLIPEQLANTYIPLLHAGLHSAAELSKYLKPRYACFRKDYFTTAKQNPQAGINTIAAGLSDENSAIQNAWYGTYDSTPGVSNAELDSEGTIYGVPIQWIRAANALQKYLERNNLAGTRLMERFLARFGVAPSSVALDMAEYLGGNRSTLQIGDVTANNEEFGAEITPTNAFNTAQTDGSSVGTLQGQLGGKCAATASSGEIKYHAKEFGTLMVIQTIVPRVTYYQGYEKGNSRGTSNDRYEYFTPEFENIGYQPVLQKELCNGTHIDNGDDVFGYVPRYQDYKYKKDVVAGDLVLSGTSAGMDSWHLARIFDLQNPPTLSVGFTTITPEARLSLDRIFSVPGPDAAVYDHFTSVIHTDCNITRPMSDDVLPELEQDKEGPTMKIDNGGVRM